MRLDVFFTRGQRFGRLAVIGLVVACTLGFFPLIFGLMLKAVEFGIAISVVIFVVISPVLVWAVLKLVRSGAWLEGTTLVVRSALVTRRCDLATTPELFLDSIAPPFLSTVGRIPRLVAKDANTRRVVRLPLRGVSGEILPPNQLRALAAAISVGVRPQPNDRDAGQVARGLTELADNPVTRIL